MATKIGCDRLIQLLPRSGRERINRALRIQAANFSSRFIENKKTKLPVNFFGILDLAATKLLNIQYFYFKEQNLPRNCLAVQTT